jgi:hypothetical protein
MHCVKNKNKVISISIVSFVFVLGIYIYNSGNDSNSFVKYIETNTTKRNYSENNVKVSPTKNNTKKDIVFIKPDKSNIVRDIASVEDVEKIDKLKNLKTKQAAMVHSQGSHQRSSDFSSNETGYAILKDVFAVKKEFADGLNLEPFEEKLGYYFYQTTEEKPEEAQIVVENNASGTFGVFTGVLKVTLYDFQDYMDLLDGISHEISNVNENTNLVFYKISDYKLAIEAYNNLKTSPKVKRVNLEILEYQRSSR